MVTDQYETLTVISLSNRIVWLNVEWVTTFSCL